MTTKAKRILGFLAGFGQVVAGGILSQGYSDWAAFQTLEGSMGLVLIVSGAITNYLSSSPSDYKFVDGLNNRRM